MSFLPYAPTTSGAWWLAGSGSVVTHAALIVFAVAGSQGLVSLAAPLPPPKPKVTITLTPLDSDIIAGLSRQEGLAGADGAKGQAPLTSVATAETPTPREAPAAPKADQITESLAALDVPTASEPETTPQSLAAVTPEASRRLAPDTASAEALPPLPALEIPEPTRPDRAQPASPIIPMNISPERAVAPQALQPVTVSPGSVTRPEPVISSTSRNAAQPSPEIISTTPIAPSRAVPTVSAQRLSATLAPIRPTSPRTSTPVAQIAAPNAQDLAIADLLRRIRSAPPQPCFLALPRGDGDTGVGLALVANSQTAIETFNDTVLTNEDSALRQTRTFVDNRQCPALEYIRQNQDYPASRLGLSLTSTVVPSGGRLTGTLRGTAGRYLTLLLIDNNGVVQDLQRFLTFSGNVTRFDVPVTRAGPPRDTGQILLAIATRTPAPVLRDRAGRLAADVFGGLTGPIADQAALGVATFDVLAP